MFLAHLFALGHAGNTIPAHNQAELWTIQKRIERKETEMYQFAESISRAPVISFSSGFFVFGGDIGSGVNSDTVALYANNIWVEGLVLYNTMID